MSITAPITTPPEQAVWPARLVLRLVDILHIERFESVGTPPERNLGASIVDAYEHDLRRLADA